MNNIQCKSIFSRISDVFTTEIQAKKAVAEMRLLTDDELRAVAGGPELEVGNGT